MKITQKEQEELRILSRNLEIGNADFSDIKENKTINKIENSEEYNLEPTYAMGNREELRKNIIKKYIKEIKSFNKEDNTYSNGVNAHKEVEIIIGYPASGKSTLTNRQSYMNHARVIDSDEVKKMIPEYDNGMGATRVHIESNIILKKIISHCVAKGENIILPIVGSKKDKVEQYLELFTKNDYKIKLSVVNLPKNKCMARAIGRFIDFGRYVSPFIINSYNNPDNILKSVIQDIENQKTDYPYNITYIKRYDNDVKLGERAKLLQSIRVDSNKNLEEVTNLKNISMNDIMKMMNDSIKPKL